MHAAGARFVAISEERGVVDYGGEDVRVVIDPLDGSLNAKRGMRSYALSIAVADGPTMADVVFGYVYDFGYGEEWTARRGEGAWLNGHRDRRPAAGAPDERRPPRAHHDRVVGPAVHRAGDGRPARARAPRAGARLDRDLLLPGRGGARRGVR